jgi:hypothetical protein
MTAFCIRHYRAFSIAAAAALAGWTVYVVARSLPVITSLVLAAFIAYALRAAHERGLKSANQPAHDPEANDRTVAALLCELSETQEMLAEEQAVTAMYTDAYDPDQASL